VVEITSVGTLWSFVASLRPALGLVCKLLPQLGGLLTRLLRDFGIFHPSHVHQSPENPLKIELIINVSPALKISDPPFFAIIRTWLYAEITFISSHDRNETDENRKKTKLDKEFF